MKKASIILGVIAGIILVSIIDIQDVYAHSSLKKTIDVHGHEKIIRMVLGHTNEPTFGVAPGIHDGKHNMEVLLSDDATRLPLAGAQLKADMFYFKDIKSFNKADSPTKADEVKTGISIGSVFGDPGHYIIRELQEPGIYGYRVYGTISYFGVETTNIDSTVFCKSSTGITTKFNSPDWSGSYGCTENIDTIKFPKKGKKD
jgi:hypothetical protein